MPQVEATPVDTPPAPEPPSWPKEPATQVATLTGHAGGVLAVAFTPDRCLLVVASRDGPGRIWDIGGSTARERATLGQAGDRFGALAFAAGSRFLAVGSGSVDGLIRLFDLSEKTPQPAGLLRGGRGAIAGLAFSPDAKQVAGGGEDNTLRLWDLGPGAKGEPRVQLPGHTQAIRGVAFAPDGQGVATAGRDGAVRLWTIGRIRSWSRVTLPHPGEVTAVAYAPDGKTVVTAGPDAVIRLWDPTAMKPTPRMELRGPAAGVRVVVMADARTLITVGDGPRVIHWDMHAGRPLREYEVPGGPASAVAITGDGRYMAAGRADGTVGVYRVAEKRS